MRKYLLGLMALGLLCWAGQAAATSVTLDNGVVKTTIADGVVTSFSGMGGVNNITAFTFVMYSPTTGAIKLSSPDVTYKFQDNKVALAGGFKADRHDFSKSLFAIGGGKVGMMYGQFTLVDNDDPVDGRDRRYLDVRYSLSAVDNITINDVRGYLVLEGSGTFDENDETKGSSAWQMVNDIQNIWSVGNLWPDTKKVLSVGQTGFIGRVGHDDFMSAAATDVWNKVNAGDALPNTIVQPGAGIPGAIAMRIPISTDPNITLIGKNTVTGVKGVGFDVDVRMEVVPEPCTMGLMLAGLAGLGAMRRRNRK
ncbi:MAG: VPLPA-CTERM sorting domain-containing protein [bacterium]|nr:VPLPA-CTERM sorting domain-containing protein [bacterium]